METLQRLQRNWGFLEPRYTEELKNTGYSSYEKVFNSDSC
jgi:hypothetical protein